MLILDDIGLCKGLVLSLFALFSHGGLNTCLAPGFFQFH